MTVTDNATNGLSQAEAQARLEQYGKNSLPEAKLTSTAVILLRQFLSPFIYILLIAAIISFAMGQTPNGIFIMVVLLLNACIGTIQEYSAQQAAAALRNMVKGRAHVIRDGTVRHIDAEEVVPGDLLLLSSGEKIAADIRLTGTQDLAVDESMLTGESLAVSKNAESHGITEDTPLSECYNQCFAGTIITHGRGQGIVTTTASETQIGKIAHDVTSSDSAKPPLMIRIQKFTYGLAAGIILAIIALTVLMLIKGGYDSRAIVMMTIGLAVSVIPEGLPAALTVALAIGMRRMAKRHVIIRKLIAVEALGSCTMICSDKTGTLTVNELTIRKIKLPNGDDYEVSGEGVGPGKLINGNNAPLQELCIAGALANESHLDYAGGEWVSDGDIVDVAFLVLAKKLGLSISELHAQQQQLKLIPYESEKAFSGSVHLCNGEPVIYAKGSPEKIMTMCSTMTVNGESKPLDTAAIEEQIKELASQGYRIIALARRKLSDQHNLVLEEMVFLGMVAMIDPVRPEVYDAIKQCRHGGIDVSMITGDHPATAKAIAVSLGLCREEDTIVTGQMIRQASRQGKDACDAIIRPARVFARIEPQQKEEIVDSFIRQGHFVAVTGDGVNDAPAMRRSNAAIAMGKRGTDVARETADLIITDDNFASIINGIEEGRVVYNNIRKVIGLLVATGFSAILLFFLTVLAGMPMPMIAVQLLWLNLVANGMQDVALAFEPKEGNELDMPPRKPTEPVFERRIIEHILIAGSVMGTVAFLNFYWTLHNGYSVEEARNLTLMLMVLFGNIHALNSRSETRSIFSMPLKSNLFLVLAVPIAQAVHILAMYTPGISDVLQLQPISLQEWLNLLMLATSLLLVEELHKAWLRHKERRKH